MIAVEITLVVASGSVLIALSRVEGARIQTREGKKTGTQTTDFITLTTSADGIHDFTTNVEFRIKLRWFLVGTKREQNRYNYTQWCVGP